MCAFEIFVGHPVCQWVSKTLEVWSHRKSFLTVLDACSGSQKPVRISLISMISGWCIVSFWVRCRCLLVVSVPPNVASRPIQFDEKKNNAKVRSSSNHLSSLDVSSGHPRLRVAAIVERCKKRFLSFISASFPDKSTIVFERTSFKEFPSKYFL